MRNRTTRSLLAAFACSALAFSAVACTDDSDDNGDETTTTEATTTTDDMGMDDDAAMGEEGNLVEVAQEAGSFNTLIAAVEAAGLAETLATGGPYTVFAPTDDAFAALPEGTLDELLADPSGDLTTILGLHVVEGTIDSSAALDAAGSCITTLGGEQLRVEIDGEQLTVGGAVVEATDVTASNGVIHVIDRVIVEPSTDC